MPDPHLLEQLGRDDRLRLMRFVCSFAWADFEIRDEEREMIARLVARLGLDEGERRQVDEWLELPPRDTDPTRVPVEHRELFRRAIRAIIEADGEIAPEELDSMRIFDRLVRE